MSMRLEKEKIVPVLLKNKAMKVNEDLYSMLIDGVKCGIDFKKNEFFWMDDAVRVTNDRNNIELQKFKALCLEAMFPKGEPSNDAPEQPGQGGVGEQQEESTIPEYEEPDNKPVPVPVQNKARSLQKANEDLTNDNVRRYICPTANDQEIFTFLKLCEHRKLNPFIKEAYLVKYGSQPATMIVGKDAFTRKAEENPMFDGFEAGIVVEYKNADNDGFISDRKQGTLVTSGEKIIGGWAKVFRKDRKVPFFAEVSMSEYDTGKSSWAKIPATMIRKVALVQALREAFPSDLGGCYDSAEMAQAGRSEA